MNLRTAVWSNAPSGYRAVAVDVATIDFSRSLIINNNGIKERLNES